ncbi:hypothetical protein PCASD_19208 [Puccinia coronata f. sp. avenae]|uniref:Uncharacterized protein n=1 Tax=Puccinia coronata f. sp. avenae TaxID=200324 RepID=A0A2N5UKV6_9BASI|nr:hypothetical protein PCASD_19208 [Puccinia coronata f. sp. avenae]
MAKDSNASESGQENIWNMAKKLLTKPPCERKGDKRLCYQPSVSLPPGGLVLSCLATLRYSEPPTRVQFTTTRPSNRSALDQGVREAPFCLTSLALKIMVCVRTLRAPQSHYRKA